MNKKNIIITGATGNIGSHLCDYLAGKGYNLILVSRTLDKLILLQDELNYKYKVSIDILAIDFESDNCYNELLTLCKKKQMIDGLVLVPPKIPATTNCFPDNEVWMNVFHKVFVKPLEFMKIVMPYLEANTQRSKVVIISGISSVQALPAYAINNVIRTAWLGQAKSLALFYGEKGIHFNSLSLGGVLTEAFLKKLIQESLETGIPVNEMVADKVNNVPLKKYASLNEVSIAIETLLSNFTDHITGSNITLDGGFIKTY